MANKITACLWFDGKAEEAAKFYTSLFPNSRIDKINRSPADTPSGPAGMVLTVDFTVAGQPFIGLDGGPDFKFNEAVSLVINCDTQAEIDYYWEKLGQGGDPTAQVCGWLKDKYGLSWQVVPRMMGELMGDSDPAKASRVMEAMLKMKKLDIAVLKAAAGGNT